MAPDELAALANALNTMASQLEQARGTEHAFLLSISHDLRTPLTSIRGYAEALADGTLDDADPNERKRAATIIENHLRPVFGSMLVSSMRTFHVEHYMTARLDAGEKV